MSDLEAGKGRMSDLKAGNVVTLRPEAENPNFALPAAAEPSRADMMALLARMDEGLQYAASVLVQLDTRVRRLELAQNKADREKAKPVILNSEGKRMS